MPAALPEALLPNEGNMLALKEKQAAEILDFKVLKTAAPAKQGTRTVLQWDERGLEVVFDCDDNGIVAEQKGRDHIKLWKDDCVYLWLDPGHTHNVKRDLIMVQVSAGGERHDVKNGDLRFDVADMVMETNRTDTGWCVTLKLPWKGLGVEPPRAGEVWGLNLSRMDQPGPEPSSWVRLPDGDLTNLDQWGHLVFARGTLEPSMAAIRTVHEARTRQIEAKAQADALELKRHQDELAARWAWPADPNATEDARKVLQYLAVLTDRQDKRFLLAQDIWSYDKGGMEAGFDHFIEALHDRTGQWLPMISVDLSAPVADSSEQAIRFAKLYWKAGGLVTTHASPNNPWTGKGVTDLAGREKLPNLIKPGTPENLVWLKQLDAYAAVFAELRDAGVVVLWRPLHEMTFENIRFYDCGAYPGKPEVFKELWRHMFRYFTEEKKLHNLLWVYSAADVEGWGGPGADSVYPGGDYVDIVGLSLYTDRVEVRGKAYEKLTALGKPFAFSEFGPAHDLKAKAFEQTTGNFDNLNLIKAVREKYPKTIYATYWHSWRGTSMSIIDNPHALELLNDPWIVGRDDLGWKQMVVQPARAR